MEEEIWKDIPGYEGLYQASTLGRFKSLPHTTIGSEGKLRHFKCKIMKLTRKENCNYGNRNKHISESKKGIDTARCCDRIGEKNPNSIKVYALNKDMTINKVYSCFREAGEALGKNESTIARRAKHEMLSNEYRSLLWYTENNLPNNFNF